MLTTTKPGKAILLSLIAFISILECNKMENETPSSFMVSTSTFQSSVKSDVAAVSGKIISTTGFPMTDLGTLIGPGLAWASGINNSDKVVGQAFSQDHPYAFLWSGKIGVIDLGTLGERVPRCSQAFDINDLGQVVGSSWYPYSTAYGINNRGEIVGNSSGYAVLWTNNLEMVQLSSQQYDGAAWDINDKGCIVGIRRIDAEGSLVQRHAALWPDVGVMPDLGTLNEYSNSQALGINNLGQVVGGSSNYLTTVHERIGSNLDNIVLDPPCVPFIWTEKKGMIQLPMLGGLEGCAHAINDIRRAVIWTVKQRLHDRI